MKIYEMNCTIDWVCANSSEEALEVYKKYLASVVGENSLDFQDIMKDTEPTELTDDQLDTLKYNDDDDCTIKRTFREELARRTKPELLATTEF